MFVRFALNLLILAIIDRVFTAAQEQDSDYWCSMCAGPGVTIKSHNYTTKEKHFGQGTINDITVYSNICHGVDDLSFVFNS